MKSNARVIYIEKKSPFNVEAVQLLHDLRTNLNIKTLHNARILNKYIIANVDDKTYRSSLNTIFSEPPVDLLFLKQFPKKPHENAFGVAFLPGQFDQRSDSAEQCLKLINPKTNAIVKTATIYVLEGKLPHDIINKIKKYLINPTDSHEININSRDYLIKYALPKPIEHINGFTKWSKLQLEKWYATQGLAMTINDLSMIQDYFISGKREPTVTEIKVIDTYWSDHCRHTTFETKLEKIEIPSGLYTNPIKKAYQLYLKAREHVYGKNTTRKISLMDIGTIVAKELRRNGGLKELDISDENNACSINVDVKINDKVEKYLLMFKNETHNHPTEIEPFGGAATCLGGAIRDPLSGRTYVYQAMRVTGSGDPTTPIEKTLPNKLPQRVITQGAARGYSSYGNQIGLATGQVDEVYHPGYVAKRMEVGAVVGAALKTNVVRKTPSNGDVIILLGGRTGKDGIGGATGSSKSHTNKSITESGAEVQKGNPICERKIQRLFRNPLATKLIKKCNDFGAGGVSVAIGELCPGIDINLDAVPKKYLGLNGTELALSESQERMAVVVANHDVNKFKLLAEQENLEATVVAKVTNTNYLRMYWNKQLIVNLSRDFLNTNGATQLANIKVESPTAYPLKVATTNINEQWNTMLNDLNVCTKTGMIQRFDSTIGAHTVLMPLGGRNQATPAEGMAALIPSFKKESSQTASLMAYGFNPYLGSWSPFHMAYYSVIESVTKIVAMGGEWKKIYLSFQEYFERLGKKEASWGKPFTALLGALTVQKALGIAAIGGKDSMSGTYENINVPPTLISFAVVTQDANKVISPEFKKINSTIALVLPKYLEDQTLDFDSLKTNYDIVHHAIVNTNIISAYSLKHYGVAEGLSKMSVGNNVGVNFQNVTEQELFGINYGGMLVEIPDGINVALLLKGSNYKIIGKTTSDPIITCKALNVNISISDIKKQISNKLSDIFSHTTKSDAQNVYLKPYFNNKPIQSKKRVALPLVVIPVFPGTNCEYDSKYAFERAGAKVELVLIRNLNNKTLLESIETLAKAIKRANIIMLPGGFSAADEPDGSAKFIVNVFNNQKIKNAVEELITKRDGLMVGICNGFQALIKLGLVPYGHIQPITSNAPTLTFNKIHHHMSAIVRTKVVSNKSPWLAALKPNDVRLVAISHGEGQFVASPQQIKEMEVNGQIATQYVNLQNAPTMNMPYNPNGSTSAIEGITSVDGRIFGKMGHSERIGKNLYRNVLGEYDQKIFESGVKYFTHKD